MAKTQKRENTLTVSSKTRTSVVTSAKEAKQVTKTKSSETEQNRLDTLSELSELDQELGMGY